MTHLFNGLEDSELDVSDKPVTLNLTLSGDFFIKIINYPVMVERYDRIVGKHNAGSKQRAYHIAFNQCERKILARWHTKFYDWYLRSGTPRKVMLKVGTIQLLQRAINFFATH